MITTECGKCFGKGNIKAFANVDGGRCFSCAGKGSIVTKKAPKSAFKNFGISAVSSETGEMVGPLFFLRAKTEDMAILMGQVEIENGQAWMAYVPSSVAAKAA